MEITECFLTKNPCYKAGKKITVKGLMLHSVGCPQPNAQSFVKKWDDPESGRACVHAFVDGNTGQVYQTLPWDHRAWHCGSGPNGSGNNTHIGVEMCEPGCIRYTGGASFTCSDRQTAVAVAKRTYEAAVELFAFLCGKFGLDPLADGVIISHKEGHDRGIASGHGDPDHLWAGLQCGYTMDTFRHAVAEAMGTAPQPAAKNADASPEQGHPNQNHPGQTYLNQDLPNQDHPNQTHPNQGLAETDFRPGDTVSLTADAVYYSGKEMPDWVKSDRWIIKSVSGDRAVIDRNVGGTREICSPVHVRYLKREKKAPAGADSVASAKTGSVAPAKTDSAAPAKTGSAAPAEAGRMTVSERGTELVAKYEGCRLEAYKCPAGIWTIGYGHTAGVQPGQTLPSKEAAKALLKEDLKKYADQVNRCVQKGLIRFPMTQNQFDALTSFCYNCGAGNLQKLVEGRTASEVAEKMMAYTKGGGKVLPGLVRRREEEKALFLSQGE